jgi:membrane-bound lytic murein transglycosylase D
MKRSAAYFPLFEKTLADYNMPDELKYLAVIESALLPTVRSRAGALGLWQFMPVSGRKFGLPMNYYFDERINPVRSTRAACELLTLLYDMFGDWELALAAYNCGPGTVKKAQRRSGKTGFWEIYDYLPSETRGYVPSFTAAMYSFEFKDELNMVVNEKHNYIPSEKVSVNKSVDLRLLAAELKMCFDDLKELNPQLLRNIIPNSSKPYDLNVPKNRVKYFHENYDKILLAAATNGKSYVNVSDFASRKYGKKGGFVAKDGNLHVVSKGETLGHIAIMYGTSVRKLMENNNLYNHKLQIGQKLFVGNNPDNDGNLSASAAKNHALKKEKNISKSYLPEKNASRSDKKTSEKKENKTNDTATKGGKIHTVVSGDSLWKIAKKYKTSVDALKKANSLKNDRLDLGQKILVPR